uniref:hypothetical protein n=1 Tax=Nocardia donostiensis TaxID=1538463 RepID=UPI00111C0955|nr:hypothetical protein [Nocardia donostiensis]
MPAREGSVGEYRLMRQGGGRGGFAHVRVVLAHADPTDGCAVVWAVDAADTTSAQPERDAKEAAAALAGAADAIDALGRLGVDASDWTVRLIWAGMNLVDTEPTAMRAAACAATAAAFGAADQFQVTYDNGWQCHPLT